MSKHLQKLAKLPVGKLSAPEGGIFAGRYIPPERINDEVWLKLLELPKPPVDGLYIPREALVETPASAKSKKHGILYKIAKAMVDYDTRNDPKFKKPIGASSKSASVIKASREPSDQLKVPQVSDWNKLSPDIETEHLGLEQLKPNERLTIVGAGITGLVLAWTVSRSRPDVKITLYDAKPAVGGWMSSRFFPVGDQNHQVLFESGPRTLLPSHPGSEIVARLLSEIGVREQLMAGVPSSSPTNQKALVFNGEIQQLPNNSLLQTIKFMAFSPLLKGARFRALLDLWNKPRSVLVNDESVHSFIARRIGPKLADRMISAVMRGIYAADSQKLSARSVARLSRMYYLERTEQMSIIGGALSGSLGFLDAYSKEALPLMFDALAPPANRGMKCIDRQMVNKEHPVPKNSLYGFPNGIQGMAQAIADDLLKRSNVELKLNTRVNSIVPKSAREIAYTVDTVTDGTLTEATANIVVSTIAHPELFSGAPFAQELMCGVKHSSLAVVNVWVPDPDAARDWFGILIPKCEDDWNKDGILGIIFDSSIRNATHNGPKEPGSAMTVMLGGDLWTEMSEDEARRRALQGLRKLKILTAETEHQAVTNVRLQRNAIPLYEVGHSRRQHAVHAALQQAYNNRVALIGMAFGRGAGVTDCVVDAVTLASRFTEQRKLLHPEFFFNHWWGMTRPEYFA